MREAEKTATNRPQHIEFLPTTAEEMRALGWDACDVIIFSGDAYVDHPSFGASLIGRWLTDKGYRTGIVPQPDPERSDDFLELGVPRLFAGVTSGAMDSMVNHYTSLGRLRSNDAYSENGKTGRRPDRALLRYVNVLQRVMKGVPIVLGGIEASLRRVSHYDFWSDLLRKSILLDTKASILVFGMGEKAVAEIALRLDSGQDLAGIRGTATFTSSLRIGEFEDFLEIPSHEEVKNSPDAFMSMNRILESESNPWNGKRLLQKADSRILCVEPPSYPLSTAEMDSLYSLPFSRRPHPRYSGEIPAFAMIRNSITAQRGCAGGCSFCALGLHQGKLISSRSSESVIGEIEKLTTMDYFRGTVTDVGGPTANMYGLGCTDSNAMKKCRRISCLHPRICRHFSTDQSSYTELLSQALHVEHVKHVFVSSGVRYDVANRDPGFVEALVRNYVSGHLKLAPEHFSPAVLRLMRKCGTDEWNTFIESFRKITRLCKKEQYVLPYIMAAFPGCSIEDMNAVRKELFRLGMKPEQVQIFLPSPMTMATAMYYTGIDPEGKKIFVERKPSGKRKQLHRIPGMNGRR